MIGACVDQIPFSKPVLLSAVQKLKSVFANGFDKPKSGNGTGFWLTTKKGNGVFVTNRHNVDPAVHGFDDSYKFESISISLRAYSRSANLPCGNVNTVTLTPSDMLLYLSSDNSDVALIKPKSSLAPTDTDLRIVSLHESQLFYQRKPEILDHVYFVGFPGKLRAAATYDLPIARSCTIASFPEVDYSNEDKSIRTTQTCLVEGFSFGGSSGSVVIREANGTPEIMGIMTGHFWENTWGTSHAGLSYLTRASAISALITQSGL
jgi:hypothetical protein